MCHISAHVRPALLRFAAWPPRTSHHIRSLALCRTFGALRRTSKQVPWVPNHSPMTVLWCSFQIHFHTGPLQIAIVQDSVSRSCFLMQWMCSNSGPSWNDAGGHLTYSLEGEGGMLWAVSQAAPLRRVIVPRPVVARFRHGISMKILLIHLASWNFGLVMILQRGHHVLNQMQESPEIP